MERQIQQEIRLRCGLLPGVVLWRNNTGVADFKGQKVRYGLALGSADLVGIVDGRFVALEVKTKTGKPTQAQEQWLGVVRSNRGFATIVRSADEAVAAIERARDPECYA